MTNTQQAQAKPQVQALLWQAITPIHPGTGQDSASVIDLPVAREGATGFPVLPASSIKGVMRGGEGLRQGDSESQDEGVKKARKYYGYAEHFEELKEGEQEAKKASSAGDLSFTDARLLALSVSSYKGTFALVTCPLILQRLKREQELLGLQGLPVPTLPQKGERAVALVSGSTALQYQDAVVLRDLDFVAHSSAEVDQVAELMTQGLPEDDRKLIAERFCVVSDDVFAFLSETATEVTAHIRLDPDRKTVMQGALWYEETIPAESLFTSFMISKTGEGLSVVEERPYLQIGGKSSVGRGLLRIVAGQKTVAAGGR